MKKLICLFLTLCLLLSLTACGGAGLDSQTGGGTTIVPLGEQTVQGTWVFAVNLKEALPIVFEMMNAGEDEPAPQELLDIIAKAIPANVALEYLFVFSNGTCQMVVNLDDMTQAMRSVMGSVYSEEVLLEIFAYRGLSEDEIRQQCGGMSVKEYVDTVKPLILEMIDYSQLAGYADNVEVRNGYMITPVGNYQIEDNRLVVDDGAIKLHFTYNGNALILDTENVDKEDVPEVLEDILAFSVVKLTKRSAQTSY